MMKSLSALEMRQSELLSALQILESCTDGSVIVRREAIIALSKFVAVESHTLILKEIMQFLLVRNGQFDIPVLWKNIPELQEVFHNRNVNNNATSTNSSGKKSSFSIKAVSTKASSGSESLLETSFSTTEHELVGKYPPIFYQLQPNEMHALISLVKYILSSDKNNTSLFGSHNTDEPAVR